MIQTAMGWHDTHLYTFENDAYTIIDPRSDAPGISADGERLVSIATEPGQRFSYHSTFEVMRPRVPMLAGPDGFPRWWVGLGENP